MSDEKKSDVQSEELLSMDQLLAKDDCIYKTLDVPAWGGKIRIGTLQASDMLDWVESAEGPAKRTAGLRLIIKSLVDKDGNRIGDESRDLQRFKTRSAAVCNDVLEEILALNKLNTKSRESVKNDSGEASTAASPSSSLVH